MDAIETLVLRSQYTTVIFGTTDLTNFELVDVHPLTEAEKTALHTRGLCFLGVICLVGGQFRTALEVELSPNTIEILSAEFCKRVAARLAAAEGDGAEWLTKLHQLPDPRAN